jgi:hypothetical protein
MPVQRTLRPLREPLRVLRPSIVLLAPKSASLITPELSTRMFAPCCGHQSIGSGNWPCWRKARDMYRYRSRCKYRDRYTYTYR